MYYGSFFLANFLSLKCPRPNYLTCVGYKLKCITFQGLSTKSTLSYWKQILFHYIVQRKYFDLSKVWHGNERCCLPETKSTQKWRHTKSSWTPLTVFFEKAIRQQLHLLSTQYSHFLKIQSGRDNSPICFDLFHFSSKKSEGYRYFQNAKFHKFNWIVGVIFLSTKSSYYLPVSISVYTCDNEIFLETGFRMPSRSHTITGLVFGTFSEMIFFCVPIHLFLWRSLRFHQRTTSMWPLQGNNDVWLYRRKKDHLLAELWQLSHPVTAWRHQSSLQKQPFLGITNTCKHSRHWPMFWVKTLKKTLKWERHKFWAGHL